MIEVFALFIVTTLFDPPAVDLNSADLQTLMTIPGLGHARATAILDYRETVSTFRDLSELAYVPGIGPGIIEEIAPFVSVGAIDLPSAVTGLVTGLPSDTALTVGFLDVGNGDAVLLASGEERILIDGGPPGDPGIRAPVIHRLIQSGVDSLSAVMFTHPHADHIGGLSDVIELYGPVLLCDPAIDHPSPVYEDLLQLAESAGCRYRVLSEGDTLHLGAEVLITVFHLEGGHSVNEASAVFLVETGEFSMLVTGDIEVETIMSLTSSASPVSVVKIPHHGSISSLFPPWSRRTAPLIAVLCVGRDNPFGHPHPAVVEDWESTGATVLRTDSLGNIFLHTDGRRLSINHSRETL